MNNKINKLAKGAESKSQSSDTLEPEISKLEIFISKLKALDPVQTEVLVLQHPQEKREELATVPILQKCLPNTLLKVGLSWPSLKKILGREVDHSRWAVIYLGTQAESQKYLDLKTPITLIGKTKNLASLEGIVVIDGSWREAKALWWRNAWLLKLNRIILNPVAPAIYNAVRKEPRSESVSTLEAVATVLAATEKRPEIYEELTNPIKSLIAEVGVRSSRGRRPTTGGKRDWRRSKKRPVGIR